MITTEAPGVSETRHRMANHQQLLAALARLRSQRAGDPEVARQLLWMAEAISLIGVLERKRVGDAGVDLAAWLAEMIPIWRRRHGPGAPEVELQSEVVVAPDSAASTLALIAQELVLNALTHGCGPGGGDHVTVRLAREGDNCVLSVSDNGPGFAGGAPSERFGLWLVRSLSSQVRGRLKLAGDDGVAATLTFPF
ncbi:sensor histidine kinase [Phenylobacterium sp.]|uniref:sensor histidine kinase n=1 Tax=Phenylobacterium sp. TaxID=1871053 RepID=UPI0035AE2284